MTSDDSEPTEARSAVPRQLSRPGPAAEEAIRSVGQPVRTAVASAADPVDRTTGRLVHLPDAPFLVGDLDAAFVLEDLVGSAVLVDNDVNWAARPEREHGDLPDRENFVYLHLGEGLGCY